VDDQHLDALPRAYRLGLRLRALGADDALIADCLGMDPDGVPTLLEIGARKLRRGRPDLGAAPAVSATEGPPHGETSRPSAPRA